MNIDRDSLILFDVLLIAVVGLSLYAISARSPEKAPTAVGCCASRPRLSALVLDVLALAAILSRISEFGFTPNRTVGLGWNLVLLANLLWLAWLSIGFLRGRKPLAALREMANLPHHRLWRLGGGRGGRLPNPVQLRVSDHLGVAGLNARVTFGLECRSRTVSPPFE